MPRDYDAQDREQPQQEPNGQKESPADPNADDKPAPSTGNGQRDEDQG